MSNLTVSVDEQLIKRARMRAIEQGTSLSAKVREFLQGYVNGSQQGLAQQRAEATARLLKAMEAAAALAAPAAPATTATATTRRRSLRDEIYEGDFRARSRAAASASAKSPRAKKLVKAAKAGKGTGARAR
ncbi:MAG: hypothetical protein J0L57_18410 [Burkholderiales bacterium]|nr:hypothetical protein [Burkholderiales bacterium]